MEKLKVKHDHKLTDILKVCMFSLFLLLPFIMFLPNVLYFAFNEHAQLDNNLSITDAIYNGWQNLWNKPTFNWTGTNNFSFTINAFTNVFGISQESHIANYICYIMTLIVIYIIYDIVISLFTKMTHLFNE